MPVIICALVIVDIFVIGVVVAASDAVVVMVVGVVIVIGVAAF